MSNQSLREAAKQALEALQGVSFDQHLGSYDEDINLAIASLREALAQPDDKAQPVARDGWKLVPVVPTEEMHAAAVRTIARCAGNDDFPPRVYQAMLYAAPQPQAEQPFQPDWMNYRQGVVDGKAEAEQGVAEKAIAAAHEQHRHYRETMMADEQGAELSDERIKEVWADVLGCVISRSEISAIRTIIEADREARGGAA